MSSGELRTERFGILKLHDKISYEVALTMLNTLLEELEKKNVEGFSTPSKQESEQP